MTFHLHASLPGAAVLLCTILVAGCAGTADAPAPIRQAGPLMVDPALLGRPTDTPPATVTLPPRVEWVPDTPLVLAEALPEPPTVAAPPIAPPLAPAEAIVALPPTAPPPVAKSAARVAVPAVTAPATVTAPAAATPPPALRPVAKPAEPPLDVAALKARLKDSPAMGVFTKLALQNQVDDLMKQFRAHYGGGKTAGVGYLRPTFDALVVKVLSLLQEGDPSLARTVASSREAIWGILSDPVKFASAS